MRDSNKPEHLNNVGEVVTRSLNAAPNSHTHAIEFDEQVSYADIEEAIKRTKELSMYTYPLLEGHRPRPQFRKMVIRPDHVQFNDKKELITLVTELGNGNKRITFVRPAEEDEYDRLQGFLWGYFLHHSGKSKTEAKKYLEEVLGKK